MTSDLLATISLDGRFTLLNPAWEHLLGWTLRGAAVAPDRGVHAPRGRRADARADAHRRGGPARAGGARELHATATATATAPGAGCCGAHAATATRGTPPPRTSPTACWLERQALHDPLTHLPNRLLLMDRAHQALARLHRSDGVVAMLFIDLDKFKAVNDNLGHDVGDRLLVSIAERLPELMRDSDTVARLGGDEFVILAEDIDSEGEALALAERVLDALERPVPRRHRRSGDARERRRVRLPQPRRRPRGDAPRGRPRDVPRQGRRRPAPGDLRREPAPRSQRADARSTGACATRCRATSCCSPTSRSCRSPAGRRSAARRSCAGARRTPTAPRRRRAAARRRSCRPPRRAS